MRNARLPHPVRLRPFDAQRGFSLVEVLVCVVILAFGSATVLTAVGSATEDVLDTVDQRKMRYLIQNLLGDIEKGKANPDDPEEEEFYEEGMQGHFEDLASDDDPEEFDGYEWYIPVFRDEVIIGAPDEDTLLEMGFETDDEGKVTGRPVSNDYVDPGLGGLGEEGEAPMEPPGQIKRILVFVVRRLGESADDDREFTVMTYLPYPDEENQQLGAESEGEGGAGGARADEGGGAGGDARGDARGGARGGGADRGGK